MVKSVLSPIVAALKILHITPWYPDERSPSRAIWIARHIKCLENHAVNHVIHISLVGEGRSSFEQDEQISRLVFKTNLPWRIKEWLFKILLFYVMIFKIKRKEFDIVNFHIAYPALVRKGWLKLVIRQPIILTEHWSAYRFNFHSRKKLTRIKKIFTPDLPVICVSKALQRDIERFCGNSIKAHIVPNVVDINVFHFKDLERTKTLLIGGYWKLPKRPFLFLDAFELFSKKHPDWKLRIFGVGPSAPALEVWCESNGQKWLGELSSTEIAQELNVSYGFVLPSDYETFSVVTAEALCCGTPVLVSDKGALPELVDPENGILTDENSWVQDLELFCMQQWDHESISLRAAARFNSRSVAATYMQVLREL